jgi:hypothetical protein
MTRVAGSFSYSLLQRRDPRNGRGDRRMELLSRFLARCDHGAIDLRCSSSA